MNGQPAKVLRPTDVRRAISLVARGRHGTRNKAMILLSVKAGLRAGEIAKLTWAMITDSNGDIGEFIELPGSAAKYGSGRRLPLQADLRQTLVRLRRRSFAGGPVDLETAVIRSERGSHMNPKAVVNWFHVLYADVGLKGCSSHSGRRTFITNAAKLVHRAGGSLRDVQLLAGHRSIQTTERYIEGDGVAQRRLVRLL
ncbi:tyrosine-type recombinase/integrase [Aestuariivirga sp.]|uniref:tyrosine-type recombinase/integrase n=1 Tax=Aestuariivirga sp. TaxID=2650926 RepID=UPI003BAB29F0